MNKGQNENNTFPQGTHEPSGCPGIREGEALAFSYACVFRYGGKFSAFVFVGGGRPSDYMYRMFSIMGRSVGSVANPLSMGTEICKRILQNYQGASGYGGKEDKRLEDPDMFPRG